MSRSIHRQYVFERRYNRGGGIFQFAFLSRIMVANYFSDFLRYDNAYSIKYITWQLQHYEQNPNHTKKRNIK